MTFFNYLLDNNVLFFGLFASTVVFLGYSFLNSSWKNNEGVTNKNTNSLSGNYSEISTQSMTPDTISSNSTILLVPPQGVSMVPHIDIKEHSLYELKYKKLKNYIT